MLDFKLPSLGADMDQGKFLEWKVKPGDAVRKGQVVAIVDTSKAAVDVEIWFDGTMHELLVAPGEILPVGAVLATVLAPGESAPPVGAARGVTTAGVAGTQGVAPAEGADETARRRISPAARKRAAELGVALGALGGSGPGGAVTLADVEQAVATDKTAAMRQAIAAAMGRSKREIPHYYLAETIPLGRAQAWLAEANAARPISERLLMAVLQLKAVALALRDFPEINGFFRDGAFQPAAAAHIGVAIALRRGGLIAPAIHDVGAKRLEQLMADLTDLVKRARAGSLRSSEMSDPTITVTNLGDEGVEIVHGVIYPPQVALVGFGRIAPRPWVTDGALVVLPTVIASLAADHRVSDGHRGALFLARVRDWLQDPEALQTPGAAAGRTP